jgi:hypothetical protein
MFKLFAAGPGSDPDNQNCVLSLSPTLWVNQGGNWGAPQGEIDALGMGGWRQSRVDLSTIIGANAEDVSDQVFQLQGVPNPMTVNKTGTGTLFKAGNRIPDGPVRWQIINILSSGSATSADSSDGGDDDDD